MKFTIFDKVLSKSVMLIGICPFDITFQEAKKSARLYHKIVLVSIILCVLTLGGRAIKENHYKYTTMEKMLTISEIFALLGMFVTVLYKTTHNYSSWKLIYSKLEDFDSYMLSRQSSDVEMGRDNYKYVKHVVKDYLHINKNINAVKDSRITHKIDVVTDTQQTQIIYDVTKIIMVHIFIPCIAVLDNRYWSNNYGFSGKAALQFLPQYIGLYFEFLLSIFLWRIAKTFEIRYSYMKTIIQETFEKKINKPEELRRSTRDIKLLYKMLYQGISSLSDIYGLIILIIILDLVMMFLLNFVWCFYISNVLISHSNIGGTIVFASIYMVSY